MIGVQVNECTGPSTMSTNGGNGQQLQRSINTRERTMHAVEYYNSNVLKARMGAGLAGPRNTIHERHHYNGRPLNSIGSRLYPQNADHMYRSNSSLELVHDPNVSQHEVNHLPGGLRREYGSHGSIDVISSDRQTVRNFI